MIRLALFSVALLTAPVHAQPVEDYETIEVTGLRDPYRLGPKQLRDAVVAYEKGRAALAPNAPLRFHIANYAGNAELTDLKLRVSADDGADARPVRIEPDGTFSLPPADYQRGIYTLMANRKAGTMRIRPLLLSPGSTPEDLRLGDLRLFCQVGWAIVKHDASFFARTMAGAIGGICNSKRVAIFLRMDRPVAKATATTSSGERALTVGRNGDSYRLPTYDRTLDNETRIRVTYASP